MSATPLMTPRSTGRSSWWRAVAGSALLHLGGGLLAFWLTHRVPRQSLQIVDVAIAPAAPAVESLPKEIATPADTGLGTSPETGVILLADGEQPNGAVNEPPADQAGANTKPMQLTANGTEGHSPSQRAKHIAKSLVAQRDNAGSLAQADPIAPPENDAGLDAMPVVAAAPPASGAATDQGSDSADTADAATDQAPPTSAGTAANLLAYFPRGHVVTALVRFDRLADTEWSTAAEALFRPMPDYRALFGDRDAGLRGNIDWLVISSPRPRDVTATTLVMKTREPRARVRELLASSAAAIEWSAAQGGLLGKRPTAVRSAADGTASATDPRVFISPWQTWFLLARPDDLGDLIAPGSGELDTIEATGTVPKWLSGLRAIENESGNEKRGPALVLTVGRGRSGPARVARYPLPELAFGVASLPIPSRASLAMELVKLGWLARGYLAFATEPEAREFVHSVTSIQQRVLSSPLLSAVVSRQNAFNAVKGLSLLRVGARVSFSTSLSNADARAIIAEATATLIEYFGPHHIETH